MRNTASLVGERIRRAREAAGISQAELSTRVGKGQAALSQWENGRRLPGLEDLMTIATTVGVPLADLLPADKTERPSGAVLLRAMIGELGSTELRPNVEDFIARAEQEPELPVLIRVPSDRPKRAASELLRKGRDFGAGGVANDPRVNVKLLAQLCGVHVIQEHFDDGLSGLLVMLDHGAAIGINAHHSPGRQRFTLAHELGHYLLAHYDRFHLDLPSAEAGESPMFDWRLEREANQFAAELLMPSDVVTELYGYGHRASQLADRFAVSEVAMGYRLEALGLTSGAG